MQMKLHKSLRLWLLYVDLEESLGTLESTRAVYERILDLKIATPQIIINYAVLLEVCILLAITAEFCSHLIILLFHMLLKEWGVFLHFASLMYEPFLGLHLLLLFFNYIRFTP